MTGSFDRVHGRVLARVWQRFDTARQRVQSRATTVYEVPDSGMRLLLRDNVDSDRWALEHLIEFSLFEPPASVAAILDSLAPLRILDLGAYIGTFGAFAFSRFRHPSVVAFEPDPLNAALHRRTIEANPSCDWKLVEACAGASAGKVRFIASGDWNARVGESGRPIRKVDIFEYVGWVDLMKIDIEGGEWELLADSRFAQIPVLLLDYHDEQAPTEQIHHAVTAALRGHGFELSFVAQRPTGGSVWAWR